MATHESILIIAGPDGPAYVGFIDQIKHCGVIKGEKDSVDAYYLDNGTIKSRSIATGRGLVSPTFYPKYFGEKITRRHVDTYTLAQLAKKYAHPDTTNVITPASK